ncbi:putative uncharacterized protein [Ruminococcus sp. CAG:330]|nr:putative uncharacterized protein [Ruminococcus sp. CAG:330]
MNLGTNADDTVFVQILQRIIAHVGDISGDLLRSQLGFTALDLQFLDVHRGKDIFSYQTLVQQNGILVVIALPGHEADEGVLAQRDLAVCGCRTVRQHLTLLDPLANADDGALIDAGRLVGTLILLELVLMGLVVVVHQNDLICGNRIDHAVIIRYHADAGVNSCLIFHTGADKRALGLQQRHCLTLHVGTHEGTVCVVVFQERDHGGCHGNYHLRRYIHEVDLIGIDFQNLITVTCCNLGMSKTSLFCQRFVRLRYNIIIFHVGSHVDYLVCDNTGLLVHSPVRRFDEAVLVDAGERCQIGDQTDVRTFRRLDRAHSAVVAVVYVTNFESGTVTGQTAGAQCGQTALVRQLCQRIVLIHELGQRRRAEEFLDGGSHRTDVDQCCRCDVLCILRLNGHALTDDTLHTGETDAELVLEQLAHRTDTAVAQMVDVVHVAHAIAQVQEVADGGEDIIQNDVLRHQLVCLSADGCLQVVLSGAALQNLVQDAEPHLFADAQRCAVEGNVAGNIHHAVTDDLGFLLDKANGALAGLCLVVFLGFYGDVGFRYAGLLHLQRLIVGEHSAGLEEHLAGIGADNRTGQLMSCQTAGNAQLLVVFITAKPAQVVPLGIEKQIVQVVQGTLHRRRFARTQLLVNFLQRIVGVLGAVLFHDGLCQTLVVVEHLLDLLVASHTQRTDEGRDRDLAVLIDADIDHVVGIHLVFQPCAAVRNDSCLEQILTGAVLFGGVVNARRTNQLGDDNTLCAVDDKSAAVGHQRKVAHVDFGFLDLAGCIISQTSGHTERCCVGDISFFALCDGVLRGSVDPIVNKIQNPVAVIVRNGRNVTKDLFQSLFPEPVVRVLLYLNQVRHFENLVDRPEIHANVFPALFWRNMHHWRKTSFTLSEMA